MKWKVSSVYVEFYKTKIKTQRSVMYRIHYRYECNIIVIIFFRQYFIMNRLLNITEGKSQTGANVDLGSTEHLLNM